MLETTPTHLLHFLMCLSHNPSHRCGTFKITHTTASSLCMHARKHTHTHLYTHIHPAPHRCTHTHPHTHTPTEVMISHILCECSEAAYGSSQAYIRFMILFRSERKFYNLSSSCTQTDKHSSTVTDPMRQEAWSDSESDITEERSATSWLSFLTKAACKVIDSPTLLE